MNFPPMELPQYVVEAPTDYKMKDKIGYHNKHLKGKISDCTAFFEICECLLTITTTFGTTINTAIYQKYL